MEKGCATCDYGRPVMVWIEQFGPKDEYCYCAHPQTCVDHSLYKKKEEKRWGFKRKEVKEDD